MNLFTYGDSWTAGDGISKHSVRHCKCGKVSGGAHIKKYNWPGNIRELKNVVESLIVINSGERIIDKMVIKHLNLEVASQNNNLPISLDGDADKLERELILKQLLYLRQDVNELKQILTANKTISCLYYLRLILIFGAVYRLVLGS